MNLLKGLDVEALLAAYKKGGTQALQNIIPQSQQPAERKVPEKVLGTGPRLTADSQPISDEPIKILETCRQETKTCLFSGRKVFQWNKGVPTVDANVTLISGKWYYEVVMLHNIENQATLVGWCNTSLIGKDCMVGRDTCSWGFCAQIGKKFHKQTWTPFTDKITKTFDVVGCGIDLSSTPTTINYYLNGKFLGTAFNDFAVDGGIHPAVSVAAFEAVMFILDEKRLKYLPKEDGYKALQNVDESKLEKDFLEDTSLLAACSKLIEYRKFCDAGAYHLDRMSVEPHHRVNELAILPLSELKKYFEADYLPRYMQIYILQKRKQFLSDYEGWTKELSGFRTDLDPEQMESKEDRQEKIRTQVLMEAIENNNLQRIKTIVNSNADVNRAIPEYGSKTPLGWALLKDISIEIIEFLIDHKADVQAPAELTSHNCPLCVAAQSNHIYAVKYLISRNADLNPKMSQTPLSWAIKNITGSLSSLDTVKTLLGSNASVNQNASACINAFNPTNKNEAIRTEILSYGIEFKFRGETSRPDEIKASLSLHQRLLNAIGRGSVEDVKVLVESGANIRQVFQNSKMNAIDIAVRNGHADLLFALLTTYEMLLPKVLVQNAVQTAIRADHTELLAHIVEKYQVDLNEEKQEVVCSNGHPLKEESVPKNWNFHCDQCGRSESMISKVWVCTDCGVGVCDRGCYAARENHISECAPLVLALSRKSVNIVYALLAKYFLSATDQQVVLATSIAAEKLHVDLMEYLLKNHNADLNVRDEDGNNVALLSSLYGVELSTYLIQYWEFQIDAPNKVGVKLIDIAAYHALKGNAVLMETLRKRFSIDKALFVLSKDFTSVSKLSEGNYGEVYKAELIIRHAGYSFEFPKNAKEVVLPPAADADNESDEKSAKVEEEIVTFQNPISIPVVCKVPKFGPGNDEWFELTILENVPRNTCILPLTGICMTFTHAAGPTTPAIMVPLKEGGSLLSYTKKFKGRKLIPLLKMATFGLDMVEGVAHLNKHGFTHNDIAARNFLLTEKEVHGADQMEGPQRIVLADFGLSRAIDRNTSLSGKQVPMRYLAPEVVKSGGRLLSPHSDIWMLGVTFWEMLSLHLAPYHFVKHNNDFTDKIVKNEVSLYFRAKVTPPAWKHVISEMCCVFDPDQRSTPSQLSEFLRNVLETGGDPKKLAVLTGDLNGDASDSDSASEVTGGDSDVSANYSSDSGHVYTGEDSDVSAEYSTDSGGHVYTGRGVPEGSGDLSEGSEDLPEGKSHGDTSGSDTESEANGGDSDVSAIYSSDSGGHVYAGERVPEGSGDPSEGSEDLPEGKADGETSDGYSSIGSNSD